MKRKMFAPCYVSPHVMFTMCKNIMVKLTSNNLTDLPLQKFCFKGTRMWDIIKEEVKYLYHITCFHFLHIIKKNTWNNIHAHDCLFLNTCEPKTHHDMKNCSISIFTISWKKIKKESNIPCCYFLQKVVNKRNCYWSSIILLCICCRHIVSLCLSPCYLRYSLSCLNMLCLVNCFLIPMSVMPLHIILNLSPKLTKGFSKIYNVLRHS